MIDNIGIIKEKLNHNKYKEGNLLKLDFYGSIDLIWKEISNPYKDNLDKFYRLNKFLIDQVIKIHESENSTDNEEILSNNISIVEAQKSLDDNKRAYNIYSFNDYDYRYYIVGDIHSDTISMDWILKKTNFFQRIVEKDKFRIIFIGDYVDRGKSHLKLVQYILSLKYLFPHNIILQRGNHEGGSHIDGKVKMCVGKSKNFVTKNWFLPYLDELTNRNKSLPRNIIDDYIKFFDSLCIISFINTGKKNYMIAHGGIPRYRNKDVSFYSYINSLADLTDEDIKDNIGKTIVNNIVWSDPTESDDDLRKDNGRFRFTEEHFNEFRELISIDYFIRGHQVKENGYERTFDGKFITLFSSGSLMKNKVNINDETAYERVNPKIIYIDKENQLKIIDLNE